MDMDPRDVVALWQACVVLPASHRSAMLASWMGGEDVLDLPLGHRDARLLALHMALIGDEIPIASACPSCGQLCSSRQSSEQLRRKAWTGVRVEPIGYEGLHVDYRLPTSRDQLACQQVQEPMEVLVLRCIEQSGLGWRLQEQLGRDPSFQRLFAHTVLQADPIAAAEVTMWCAECQDHWYVELAIGERVWQVVEAMAWCTLLEAAQARQGSAGRPAAGRCSTLPDPTPH